MVLLVVLLCCWVPLCTTSLPPDFTVTSQPSLSRRARASTRCRKMGSLQQASAVRTESACSLGPQQPADLVVVDVRYLGCFVVRY